MLAAEQGPILLTHIIESYLVVGPGCAFGAISSWLLLEYAGSQTPLSADICASATWLSESTS